MRDEADGMMLAAEHGRIGERYILGGENMRLRALAQAVALMSGALGAVRQRQVAVADGALARRVPPG